MRHAILALTVIGMAGCGADRESGSVAVRDSAGVRIVWTAPPDDSLAVRLAAEPLVRLSGAEGGSEPFHDINGVQGLGPRGFVVAVNGLSQLRFYGADGELRATGGRAGSGPGEFGFIGWLQRWQADSVLVYDARQRRLSVWSADGELGREFAFDVPSPRPEGHVFAVTRSAPLSVFGDGTVLWDAGAAFLAHGGEGLRTVQTTLLRSDGAGGRADTLGVFAGIDYYELAEPTGGRRVPIPMGRVGYSRTMVFARAIDRFAVAENRSNRIAEYGADGQLARSLRVRRALEPVTAERRSAWREANAGGGANGPAGADVPVAFPDSMPVWERLLAEGAQRVWARRYSIDDSATRRWEVFGSDGALSAVLEAPPRFDIHSVGVERLYGVARDSLDVEYVEVFELPAALRVP